MYILFSMPSVFHLEAITKFTDAHFNHSALLNSPNCWLIQTILLRTIPFQFTASWLCVIPFSNRHSFNHNPLNYYNLEFNAHVAFFCWWMKIAGRVSPLVFDSIAQVTMRLSGADLVQVFLTHFFVVDAFVYFK